MKDKILKVIFSAMGLITFFMVIFGVGGIFLVLAIKYSWWWFSAIVIWEVLGYYRAKWYKKQGKHLDGFIYR